MDTGVTIWAGWDVDSLSFKERLRRRRTDDSSARALRHLKWSNCATLSTPRHTGLDWPGAVCEILRLTTQCIYFSSTGTFRKVFKSLFQHLYFFLHRHIQSSYWFYISTLGCHGLLRISNSLSSSLLLGSYLYQILTGHSFKLSFTYQKFLLGLSIVERCLPLPCHHTTDLVRWVRGHTGTGLNHNNMASQKHKLSIGIWYFLKVTLNKNICHVSR